MAMEVRELRGLEIVSRLRIEKCGSLFLVPSQFERDRVYRVNPDTDPPTCDCEDFAVRRQICKHGFALRLFQLMENGGALPRPEYPCDVPAGAPTWVSTELIYETIRVFQFYYRERLSPDDALAMILNASLLYGEQPRKEAAS